MLPITAKFVRTKDSYPACLARDDVMQINVTDNI